MEQTIAERPVSQEQQIHHVTGLSRNCMPSGSFGGDNQVCRDFLRGRCARGTSCRFQHCESDGHDGVRPHVCRDFLQGRCTYGVSCKFRHPESDNHDRSGSHGNANSSDVSNPGTSHFHGANTDNDFRTRSFSHRSRSPCRKFQSGRCFRGAACPYVHPQDSNFRPRYELSRQLQQGVITCSSDPVFGEGSIDATFRTSQEHDNANKDSGLGTGSFHRDYRSRSPCRKFLRGMCERGASCPRLHILKDNRPNCDLSTQQHQGLASTSRNPVFSDGNMVITSRASHEHDVVKKHGVQLGQDIHAGSKLSVNGSAASVPNETWPLKDAMQSSFERENMDINSRHWSSERQRSRPLGNFGGDKLKLEVCLKFTRGRCDRGESCKYLHGFHEYAKAIPDLSRQPYFEAAAAASRNFGGAHQYARSVTCPEQDHVKNYNMLTREHRHAGSRFISRGDSFDEKTKRHSVHHTVRPNMIDERGEVVDMDRQRCKISGGAITRTCDIAEETDMNLWSRPLKRRRSRSRSPFNPKDDCGRRGIRRDGSQNNFSRDRCYNVAPVQYQYCHPYQYKRPRSHVNSHYSKVDSTSPNSCPRDTKKVSNLIETPQHDIVTSHGMQLDQSPGGGHHSNTVVLNLKGEAESAKGALQPRHVELDDKDSNAAATLVESCSHEHEVKKEPDVTQGHDKVMDHAMQLDQCHGGSFDSNTAILNQVSEGEPDKSALQQSQVNQDGERLATESSEIKISKGETAINLEFAKADLTSFSVENNKSLMDTDGNVLNKDDSAEVNICLRQEESDKDDETKQELKTYTRKRRRRRRSKAVKGEVTDPSTQGLSSSSAAETSLRPSDILSVAGVSDDDDKNVLKTSSVTIEPTKDDINPLGDSDGQSMQSSDSSSKAAIVKSARKLLILDLNGLLADIVSDAPGSYKADTVVSGKALFKRPFCDDFLKFCFERFDVGVWSSRAKKNVNTVVNFLMGKSKKRLLFCWDQSHCTATGYKTMENKDKPLVLKELHKLWEKHVAELPWEKGLYNETNTVLLDDSPYKALRNPPYTGIFPKPYTFRNVKDKSLGPGGDLRVYLERLATADDVQKFIQENPFGQRPITKSNLSWGFYSKIVGAYGRQQEGNASKQCPIVANSVS